MARDTATAAATGGKQYTAKKRNHLVHGMWRAADSSMNSHMMAEVGRMMKAKAHSSMDTQVAERCAAAGPGALLDLGPGLEYGVGKK